MKSSYLPSPVWSILFTFRPCFTAPSFENFVALVCGWILCPGVHTISRVIVTACAHGLAPKGHGAYYRFLSRARWSADEVGHGLLRLLLPFLPDEIEAAVDDTLCHRTGPQIFGVGIHHDASQSTYGGEGGQRVGFGFGHNWVVLSVWVPLPWNPERGIAIPILFRLYRAKRRCPKAAYRKRTELAREMVMEMLRWLPMDRQLNLAGDSEYACRTLLRNRPDRLVFSGPMCRDAALFAVPRPPLKLRGRPRLKGTRLPSPEQRGRGGRWEKQELRLYGRDVVLLLQTFTCLWYTVAGTQLVRVVLTRDPKRRWQDRAYFCTDTCRSPAQILARVGHRWQLEVTFQTAKQLLGLEEPRNGWWRRLAGHRTDRRKAGAQPRGNAGRRAVEHTVPLILVAYGVVAAWFFRHGDALRETRKQRIRKPWYGLKREPAYADMLAALRREFWAQRLSRYPSLRPHRRKVLRLIEECVCAA